MNHQIEKLYRICQQPTRRIIGLMSGTSLDGLDIALCEVQNSGTSTQMKLEKFVTMDYTDDFRQFVRRIFAKRQIDQQDLCGLNAYIGLVHADLINKALRSEEHTSELQSR